ncbi:unnamed protein product [Amoebophrya sp. A25]|nr:unnamed protein product [Amoebophrya sp. A25]|eukprot:GSA25T00002469001.1
MGCCCAKPDQGLLRQLKETSQTFAEDPGAPGLCLVAKGSPYQLVFANALELQQSAASSVGRDPAAARSVPLTCSIGRPGAGEFELIQKRTHGPYWVFECHWWVSDLGLSSPSGALPTLAAPNQYGVPGASVARPGRSVGMTMDSEGFLTRKEDMAVLNVSEWQFKIGKRVELIRETSDVNPMGKTRKGHGKPGGRAWIVNTAAVGMVAGMYSNMGTNTLSPREAPHLVVGVQTPDVTLVPRGSADGFQFEALQTARKSGGIITGGACFRMVSSTISGRFSGYAVVGRQNPPDYYAAAEAHFQHCCVGFADADAANVLSIRLDHAGQHNGRPTYFLCSDSPVTGGFILDVPFDKRQVGTSDMPIALVKSPQGWWRKPENKAEVWIVNEDDGSISPAHSPELVLGIRPGNALVPLADLGGAGGKVQSSTIETGLPGSGDGLNFSINNIELGLNTGTMGWGQTNAMSSEALNADPASISIGYT